MIEKIDKRRIDNTDFILSIYADEIKNRKSWAIMAAEELNNATSASEIMRKATEIINHAMSIMRMFEKSGFIKDETTRELVEKRIRLLNERWHIPKAPNRLRIVRNTLEHFEEKIDKWAAESEDHIFVDNCVGFIGGIDSKKYFRHLEKDNFSILGKSLNLTEVCNWIIKVNEIVSH